MPVLRKLTQFHITVFLISTIIHTSSFIIRLQVKVIFPFLVFFEEAFGKAWLCCLASAVAACGQVLSKSGVAFGKGRFNIGTACGQALSIFESKFWADEF
jgi:hypothetical protein